MGAFHAYDIRGIYNKDFNKDTVYKVGYFLPELLKTDRILVGRDVRESSPEIHEYLIKGIRSEEHTSELQSHPEIYYVVFCLIK